MQEIINKNKKITIGSPKGKALVMFDYKKKYPCMYNDLVIKNPAI